MRNSESSLAHLTFATYTPSSTQLASILGVQSEFKCPICLVPANALWDLCGSPHPKRTRNKTLTLIASANEQTSATAARKKLTTQSVRGVPVSNVIVVTDAGMLTTPVEYDPQLL